MVVGWGLELRSPRGRFYGNSACVRVRRDFLSVARMCVDESVWGTPVTEFRNSHCVVGGTWARMSGLARTGSEKYEGTGQRSNDGTLWKTTNLNTRRT